MHREGPGAHTPIRGLLLWARQSLNPEGEGRRGGDEEAGWEGVGRTGGPAK